MKTQQELDVNYISGADNPWIPFTPLSDQVFLKYWKVDPVRAEIIVSMKVPAGVQLALPHRHRCGAHHQRRLALQGEQLGRARR